MNPNLGGSPYYMVDLAAGIIIGGAFGGIVQSLIKDVIMPLVGIAGNIDFTNAYIPLGEAVSTAHEADPTLSLETARAGVRVSIRLLRLSETDYDGNGVPDTWTAWKLG